MAKASDNVFPYVHVAPAAAPSSPSAGSQRLYLDSGDGNKLKRKDSSGTVTTIEGGGGGAAVLTAKATRTAGDITPTADATWRAADTGGSLDVTIAAATGDVVELTPSFLVNAQSGGTTATIKFTARTRVSSADVNDISGATSTGGVLGWFCPAGLCAVSGGFLYTVQAGDISGGNVTFRLYYSNDNGGAGSARAIFASTTNPAVVSVKNLGH